MLPIHNSYFCQYDCYYINLKGSWPLTALFHIYMFFFCKR